MRFSHHIVLATFLISPWVVPYGRAGPLQYESAYDAELTKQFNFVAGENLSKQSTDNIQREYLRGLTWDKCRRNIDCLAPRTCRRISRSGGSEVCNAQTDCVCDTTHSEKGCLSNAECHGGESCVIPFGGSVGACLSKEASGGKATSPKGERPAAEASASAALEQVLPSEPDQHHEEPKFSPMSSSPSDGTENKSEAQSVTSQTAKPQGGRFCIGMNALEHLSRRELVFESDEEALVLCDGFESCATGGHIVIVNGSSMMMSSYCRQVQCHERIMRVNSPRYRRDLKIRSKTPGMLFTGYSARYGTKVEENVFGVLTRLRF